MAGILPRSNEKYGELIIRTWLVHTNIGKKVTSNLFYRVLEGNVQGGM